MLGQSPLEAGVTLLPLSVSVLGVSLLTTSWGRYVHAKYLILIGAALMGVGILWSAVVVGAGMSAWDFALPLLVFGAGTGLLLAQVPNLTLSSVDPSEGPEASGVQNAAKETGTSLGTAIIGSVLLVATFSGVVSSLAAESGQQLDAAEREQITVEFEDLLESLDANQQKELYQQIDAEVDGRLGTIVTEAQVDAMRHALAAVGAFIAAAFLAATFLPRGKLEDDRHIDADHTIERRTATPQRGL